MLFFSQTNEAVGFVRFFFGCFPSVFTLLAFASKVMTEAMNSDSAFRTPYQGVVGFVAITKAGPTCRLELIFFALILVWFHQLQIFFELLATIQKLYRIIIFDALLLYINFSEVVEKVQRPFIESNHQVFLDDELTISSFQLTRFIHLLLVRFKKIIRLIPEIPLDI